MNYKPIDVKDIPYEYRHSGRNKELLAEFAKSDFDAIEIDWRERGHKNATQCAATFITAIKREGYHMKALLRSNRVFIVKKGE